MKILVATKNAHKTGEIQKILGPKFEVSDLTAHPEIISPEETGASFEENAVIKALAASRLFDGMVLADDSGLEVDALAGAPGVRSARYAGENASDADNRQLLLKEMAKAGARGKQRSARFHCVLVLAQKGKVLGTFDGRVEGVIVNEPKGNGGFGYDPLFVPEGYCETFAELPAGVKNQLSHRGKALEKLQKALG